MNMEQLIAKCIEARRTYERAEVDYFEFLSDVERDHENIWKPACGTFTSFLEQYVGVPRPSRYVEFRASVDKITIKVVREIGIDAATTSLRASTKGKQGEFVESARGWSRDHDGVHPSRETARDMLAKVDPRVPPDPSPETELDRLRAECARLKRENHRLERVNAKLVAENSKLKGKRPLPTQPRA